MFNAALAEFELHFWSLQYPGNANLDGDETILLAPLRVRSQSTGFAVGSTPF